MNRSTTPCGLAKAILALAAIAVAASIASAKIYHSRESALKLAFGDEVAVESRELFLSKAEQAEASRSAGSEITSRLVRQYEGRCEGEVAGYVYFETHQVRSLPETLMIVVSPKGTVASVHVLAFHEPEVYLPHQRFLRQFAGSELGSELSLRTGIQGIAGSTFTANAVTAAVRRVLAVHDVTTRSSTESH